MDIDLTGNGMVNLQMVGAVVNAKVGTLLVIPTIIGNLFPVGMVIHDPADYYPFTLSDGSGPVRQVEIQTEIERIDRLRSAMCGDGKGSTRELFAVESETTEGQFICSRWNQQRRQCGRQPGGRNRVQYFSGQRDRMEGECNGEGGSTACESGR